VSAQPSAAIVPYRSKLPLVQFAADGVAADVRVEPLDRRQGSCLYAIRLASTDENVVGRLVGELASGEPVELGDLAVTPGSIGGARLAVTPPPGGYRAVYLEIRSERVLLRVEAPKPPSARRFRPFGAAAIAVGLGVLSVGAGTLALAVPVPPVLREPEHVVAGDLVHVRYAARGYGNERFTARYDDGVVCASGPLESKNGDLTLALPRDAAHRRVWVAVTTQGPLGSAAGVTSFAVAAAPTARIVARTPFAYVAPRPRPHVVAPPPAKTPAPSRPPRLPTETAGMLSFEPDPVAGSELAVRVMPHRSTMTVALQDVDGATLAEREIAPGATSVTLPMPERPAMYYLLLRYDAEDGLQTVVRPVRAVAPPAGQASSR
jgi:hypothetical protein